MLHQRQRQARPIACKAFRQRLRIDLGGGPQGLSCSLARETKQTADFGGGTAAHRSHATLRQGHRCCTSPADPGVQ